jgi:hypothetical protein
MPAMIAETQVRCWRPWKGSAWLSVMSLATTMVMQMEVITDEL